MVILQGRTVLPFIIWFFLAPAFLFSGDFISSVDRTQVNVGENLILNLTLKDASALNHPSTSILNENFHINSQQQSQNTMMMNGRFSSSVTWRISLTPKREGLITIPSIDVNTSEGILSSYPITIKVQKGNSTDPSLDGISTKLELSNLKPYKNEPFFYNAKVISKHNLTNVKMQRLSIDDAIVEANGDPKIYQRIEDGVRVNVIEISYLVIPLKSGQLKIPSISVQGGIPVKTKRHHGHSHDFFDSIFIGFDQLQPFTVATEEKMIDVQQPVPGMQPWLPAQSLTIEEIWDGAQSLQVGEPITRSFKIVAAGIVASQLPSLADQYNSESFKVYADKPEMGQEVKDGHIVSYRKEQFTLIPQQSGEMSLPAISIDWWDVSNNRKATAYVDARELHILAATDQDGSHIAFNQDNKAALHSYHEQINDRVPLIYALIAGLSIALFAVVLWAIILQQKINRLTSTASVPKAVANEGKYKQNEISLSILKKTEIAPQKAKKDKLPDLNPT